KLTEQVDILKRISSLPNDKFRTAKELYMKLNEAREKRHTKEIHIISKKLASILDVELEDFQKATRDKILKNSIENLFSITKNNHK
ncbi:MAG: hypothetical protein ACTSRP_28595, partial [Candidatus Helarchaeota archaeon]